MVLAVTGVGWFSPPNVDNTCLFLAWILINNWSGCNTSLVTLEPIHSVQMTRVNIFQFVLLSHLVTIPTIPRFDAGNKNEVLCNNRCFGYYKVVRVHTNYNIIMAIMVVDREMILSLRMGLIYRYHIGTPNYLLIEGRVWPTTFAGFDNSKCEKRIFFCQNYY